MPTIKRPDLYNATFSAAKEIFARPGALAPFSMTKEKGTLLYRYVNYRRNKDKPEEENQEKSQKEKAALKKWRTQIEEDARKIHQPLDKDKFNRWTGLGSDGKGFPGLYMAGKIEANQAFPELEHYQKPNEDIERERSEESEKIECWRAEGGIRDTIEARKLRAMFTFSTTEDLNGIDLSLQIDGKDHPLLTEIVALVKESKPAILKNEESLSSLYLSDDDASFTRAIGNALFEVDKSIEFFKVTSIRDEERKNYNIILRAKEYNAQDKYSFEHLEAFIRDTYLVDEKGKRGIQVYTDDDQKYMVQLFEKVKERWDAEDAEYKRLNEGG